VRAALEVQGDNILELIRACLPPDVVTISFNAETSPSSSLSTSVGGLVTFQGYPSFHIKLQRRIPYTEVRTWPDTRSSQSIIARAQSDMPKTFTEIGKLVRCEAVQDFASLNLIMNLEYVIVKSHEEFVAILKKDTWTKYSNEFDRSLVDTLSS